MQKSGTPRGTVCPSWSSLWNDLSSKGDHLPVFSGTDLVYKLSLLLTKALSSLLHVRTQSINHMAILLLALSQVPFHPLSAFTF